MGKASEAAAKAVDEGDAASEARAIDILKVLAGSQVTAPLLKETDAGKRINRLSKSSNEQIAAAASSVVQAWKACVKKQAADSGVQPSSSLPGVSSARSLSLPGDSEQQEASTSQPAAATQPERSSTPAGTASASKPPPKAGDPKRDKVWHQRLVSGCCLLWVSLCVEFANHLCVRVLALGCSGGRQFPCGDCIPACVHDPPVTVHCPQVRVLLVAGLALVPDDERGGQEPRDVAAEVETAIFQKFGSTGAEYGAKVRSQASPPVAVWSSLPSPCHTAAIGAWPHTQLWGYKKLRCSNATGPRGASVWK